VKREKGSQERGKDNETELHSWGVNPTVERG